MEYSYGSLYGEDAQVPQSTGGSGKQFKNMAPKTVKLDDGTYDIDGFVEDVKIEAWEYDEAKKQLIITFVDPTGATARKYITDPETREYITSKEPMKANELAGYVLKEIERNATQYVYSNAVKQTIAGLGKFTFETYVKALGELVMGEKNKTNNQVDLKLAFLQPSGPEMKFVIPNNSYIGSGAYGPKWAKSDDAEKSKYNDITNFEFVEQQPDFVANAPEDNIDDIFGTSPSTSLLG